MTKTKQNTTPCEAMWRKEQLCTEGVRGWFVSSGEMLGWQLTCRFPLTVGAPSSPNDGHNKITVISFCAHTFCAPCLENQHYIQRALVLDQQGHSIHTTEWHLCVYQGLLFTGCGNCHMPYLQWACPPTVYTGFSRRELKAEYFRGLNTQYIKRYL